MNGLAWLLIVGAPSLAWLALRIAGPERLGSWVWLACLPALVAVWAPPANLALPAMWPGAGLALSELERPWLGFTALLWACAGCYAARDLRGDVRSLRFWSFWLIALSGNLLLLVAQDLGTFYVGFSMMSLAGYGLIVHLRGPGPRQAGRIYLQLAILGEMLLFSGIIMRLHQGAGSASLLALQAIETDAVTALLLLLGLGLKAGFWPLHIWLPLAHPAAPAAASAVLSGAMIKAGLYGLWRLLPAEDPLVQGWAPTLLALGFISIFYGALVGVLQARPKIVLAFSSVSQMGYLLAILAIVWLQPDAMAAPGALLALFAVHHGLAKGALFMGAGLASHNRLGLLHWVLLALPAVALAGLPLSSGAAVKLMFKELLEANYGPWLVLLLSLGSSGTALLMIRALWLMNQTMPARGPAPPLNQWLPLAVLCLLTVALPWLVPVLREPSLYAMGPAAWSLSWPVLVAALIALVAWRSAIPAALIRRWLPAPARYWSLMLKRLAQPRLGPALRPGRPAWRSGERLMNRLVTIEPVSASGWVLLVMLFVGWVMAL